MSIEGTLALKRDREGFDYARPLWLSVLSVSERIDLPLTTQSAHSSWTLVLALGMSW